MNIHELGSSMRESKILKRTEALFVGDPAILPYDKLKPASSRIPLDELDPDTLRKLHNMGDGIVTERGFTAIAYTQLHANMYQDYPGLSSSLRNVMYFNKENDNTYANCLMINPQVEVIGTATVPTFEACGSIENGTVWMLFARPESVRIQAMLYRPNDDDQLLTPINEIVTGSLAGILNHEQHHIDGGSAMAHLDKIIDTSLMKKQDWEDILFENNTDMFDPIMAQKKMKYLLRYQGGQIEKTSIPPELMDAVVSHTLYKTQQRNRVKDFISILHH